MKALHAALKSALSQSDCHAAFGAVPLRILYVGSYKQTYPRNRIFIHGLRQNGAIVTECNESSGGLMKYLRLALRLFRLRGTYDVMLVGFPGQEVMFVARLFASAPIVFDVFTSHYMGYILDRAYFKPGSFRARVYRFLDYWSCRFADMIILDTNAHIDFFVSEFKLPRTKFQRIFLGANTDLHAPRSQEKNSQECTVLFWGSFIPLQGTEYILEAARLLRDERIRFILIGDGQKRARDIQEAQRLQLTNIQFPGKVSDDVLTDYIRNADICLGAFSMGQKADITIQNKIFETLASRKPLITMRTTAIEELLTDGEQCLFCEKASPHDLAKKIILLRDNAILRASLAERGYQFFMEHLTEESIGRELLAKIKLLCKKS
ncbi:MAG: glycosyltransferase [Candidatus Pacebacteria bacterium]|nr:glycosyltransferase [Candidatus Paceibacterota bacterium]